MNMNNLQNIINQKPNCVNFIDGGDNNNCYCKILSNKTATPFIVEKEMCSSLCLSTGPYNNKEISKNEEDRFFTRLLKHFKDQISEKTFKDIITTYNSIFDIVIPTFYENLKKELNFLTSYDGYKKFTLTGNCITSTFNPSSEKINVVLWFESLNDYIQQNISEILPMNINGVDVNYMIFTGDDKDVDFSFVYQLDIENNILYRSKYIEMKIRSLPTNISIKYTNREYYNNLELNNILGSEILNQENVELPKPKSGWGAVAHTWYSASRFIEAVSSRGYVSTALDYMNINNSGGERVADEIYKIRKQSCFGDPDNNIKPCEMLVKNGKNYQCKACGCGANKLAILNTTDDDDYSKLHYPHLECPLAKAGFSNHTT